VNELAASSLTAFWLGILAAISPCPLATNIAAISYIGKDLESAPRVLASGAFYALGRVAAYVGVATLVVSSLLSIPAVASFLQGRMNQILGPLLVVIGAFVLGWIRLPALQWGRRGEALEHRAARGGLAGAGLLGILFALSFCPISAGLFFGSLVPLSMSSGSRIVVPAFFGLGTGLPVVVFAVLLGLGVRQLGGVFQALTRVERWARLSTGVVFIVIGLYFVATRIAGWSL
jgi:cytochrome c biogenesis protein CcdA